MTKTMTSLADFICSRRITMTAKPTATNPSMPDSSMDHWRCTLAYSPYHKLRVTFSMGRGHHGQPPTTEDVLECLASDAASVENSGDFAEWASDLGFDPDCRKALASYRACVRQTEKLKSWLGIQYCILLWETER